MGTCIATEMRSRQDRELTFANDSRIVCNENFIDFNEQNKNEDYSIEGETGQTLSKNQNNTKEKYFKIRITPKESTSNIISTQEQKDLKLSQDNISKDIYSNSQDINLKIQQDTNIKKQYDPNPKVLLRQSCKEVIPILVDEDNLVKNKNNCGNQSSIYNLHQISRQSTRNQSNSISSTASNTQTSLPLIQISIGLTVSQSNISISSIPQLRNNNLMSPSRMQIQNFNNNGQTPSKDRFEPRQKSQSFQKQRKNSRTRRTSMTIIDNSISIQMNNNDNNKSNYLQPQKHIDKLLYRLEDIISLVNNKNTDQETIQKVCDDYIERKRIEYFCNEYTAEEFQNCIQEITVILFKSQLQDLGKHYLDKLVHHKKICAKKNLLKNFQVYQKKL